MANGLIFALAAAIVHLCKIEECLPDDCGKEVDSFGKDVYIPVIKASTYKPPRRPVRPNVVRKPKPKVVRPRPKPVQKREPTP